jgi:hypothetical protein
VVRENFDSPTINKMFADVSSTHTRSNRPVRATAQQPRLPEGKAAGGTSKITVKQPEKRRVKAKVKVGRTKKKGKRRASSSTSSAEESDLSLDDGMDTSSDLLTELEDGEEDEPVPEPRKRGRPPKAKGTVKGANGKGKTGGEPLSPAKRKRPVAEAREAGPEIRGKAKGKQGGQGKGKALEKTPSASLMPASSAPATSGHSAHPRPPSSSQQTFDPSTISLSRTAYSDLLDRKEGWNLRTMDVLVWVFVRDGDWDRSAAERSENAGEGNAETKSKSGFWWPAKVRAFPLLTSQSGFLQMSNRHRH